MIQYSNLGIMQGRLSPSFQNNIQHFPVNHWQEEFQSLADLGMGCLEWVYEYSTVEQNPIHFPEKLDEIQETLDKSNLRINSVIGDYFMEKHLVGVTENEKENNLKVLKHLIDQCFSLGVTIIELPFVDSSSLTIDSLFHDLVKNLSPLVKYANERGIRISLETDLHPKKFEELLNLFLPMQVYVNYDMGNSASYGFDPIEEIAILGERIINVHIKDRLKGGMSVPLGTGNTDFSTVFRELDKADYQGDFILQAARKDINNNGNQEHYKETVQSYIELILEYL